MSDFDLSDIEEMQVSLELEDGSTLECEVIYIFEWNGDDYAALTPVDESIEEIYFFGIQIDTEGDQPEITLLQIEDDETLDAISDALTKCSMKRNLARMTKRMMTTDAGMSLLTKSWIR